MNGEKQQPRLQLGSCKRENRIAWIKVSFTFLFNDFPFVSCFVMVYTIGAQS
jgi:hypothetical protein